MQIVRPLIVIAFAIVNHGMFATAGERQFRRPIAVALSEDANRLFVANRDSGTISIVDLSTLTANDEIALGGRLTDITALPQDQLLVLDEKEHRLLRVDLRGDQPRILSTTRVAQNPVRVVHDRVANRCFVSSLWSRTISVFQLATEEGASEPQLAKSIPLPFEPRELCLTPDGRQLVVAAAFDARIAVIGTDDLALCSIREIPGHNIRGLAIPAGAKQLLVAQQELSPLAHSSRDDVHWGNMISNLWASIRLDRINDPSAEIHRFSHQLGRPGLATGDPGRVIVGPDGGVAVLFSGVNEVAIAKPDDPNVFRRVPVGVRPVAATWSPQGMLLVANMFSDSISVVSFAEAREIDRVSLGEQPELDLVHRGEMLFFNSHLSLEGWMSCHSCHTDGHSNGQLNDNLSDGSFGAPKRVPSLLGVSDTKPWGWNGKVDSLEQQVINSIENTMQGATPDDQQVSALVAFMKTLATPAASQADVKASILRGQGLFETLRCGSCHVPPTYTSPQTFSVGTSDSVGNTDFNPPSLRGVAYRSSFFHDGRATSLREVFDVHKHQVGDELSADDIDPLVDFLRSLGPTRL